MKTRMIPCEIETADGYTIPAEALPHTMRGGKVVVRIDGHGFYEGIALDDLTDDSRRLVLNHDK